MPRRAPSFVPAPTRLICGENGRDVVRVETPSGVVGYIATCVTDDVLDAFIKKLRRKIARRQQSHNGAASKASPRCST